jgi:hypothetical protein
MRLFVNVVGVVASIKRRRQRWQKLRLLRLCLLRWSGLSRLVSSLLLQSIGLLLLQESTVVIKSSTVSVNALQPTSAKLTNPVQIAADNDSIGAVLRLNGRADRSCCQWSYK